MKVLNRKSFKLPFVGRDKFIRLSKAGLGYDGGSFFIKDQNNLEKIIDVVSDVLNENVSFLQTCTLCRTDFTCSDCKYRNLCPTRDLPLQCICENCRESSPIYDRYVTL